MHPSFKSLTLSGWRQFHDIKIEFHPRLTVITGANGAGKSTLLGLLTPHFGWQRHLLGTPKKKRVRGNPTFLTGLRRRLAINFNNEVGEVAYSIGSNARIHVVGEAQVYSASLIGQSNVLGTYISSHRAVNVFQQLQAVSPSSIQPNHAYQLYQHESIQRFSGNHSQGTIFRLKEALVSMATFGVSNEFADGDESSLENLRGFVEILKKVLPPSLGFKGLSIRVTDVVMETESGNFLIDSASGGLLSLIDMAWQIYIYSLTSVVSGAEGFTVIMDEPENHLHPSMQRTLLSDLIEAFPNAQFIVATHSPFMVSSVRDSFVYALRYAPSTSSEVGEDVDDGVPVSKMVISEKLDVINRAGPATEILRDVLGVPVTIPEWVEKQLSDIVSEFRRKELDAEGIMELRARMTELGFGELFPQALSQVAK